MTAQGIMNGAGSAMNAMFSGFPAVGGSVKGMQEGSFEQFMETSKSGKNEISVAPTKDVSVNETSGEREDVRERAKAMFSGENKVKEIETTVTEETNEVPEEAMEAVATLVVQIRQVICETLGITDEQLTETMEALDLKDADLLDRDSLQQIFLNLNQADPTEFLTNEGMFQEFTDLVQTVEQTVDAAEISPEEVRKVLESLQNEEATVEADAEVIDFAADYIEEKLPEQETQDEDAVEATTENVEAKTLEASEQTKTESGESGTEGHKAAAKKEGNVTIVSSENDANVKSVFIDTLANYAANETGEANAELTAQVREIANQIMEQIKITIRPEQTNMELQLNPEHLGRVNLTITEKEGAMTAQFTTQSEVAKEAIESQMAALRESLQNQGIKVEAIEVTVSEFGFRQDEEARQNGNGEPEKRRKAGTFQVEDVEEDVPQMTEYLNVTDSSVDYSA